MNITVHMPMSMEMQCQSAQALADDAVGKKEANGRSLVS